MYTRSYFTEDAGVSVPENYDGNAFLESEAKKNTDEKYEPTESSLENQSTSEEKSDDESERVGLFSSVFDKLPFKSIFSDGGILGSFGSIFKSDRGSIKLGAEEILLCALAAYLFLSKDGDKECAIMLLILVFIT